MLKAYSIVFWHLISNCQRLSRQIQVFLIYCQYDFKQIQDTIINIIIMNLEPQTTRFKWMVGDFQPFFYVSVIWKHPIETTVKLQMFQECSHVNIPYMWLFLSHYSCMKSSSLHWDWRRLNEKTQGYLPVRPPEFPCFKRSLWEWYGSLTYISVYTYNMTYIYTL